MTDLLGPASALNAVTVRPADIRVFGPDDSWFKACENGVDGTGTIIQAAFLNGSLAQMRTVIREAGVTVDNADDEMLWKAIQRALNLNFTTKRLPWMAVNSLGVYEPPASPADGDTYVVPSGASGDWTGQGLRLAQWDDDLAIWRFQSAPTGTVVWSADTNEAWRKTETVWVRAVATADDEGFYRFPDDITQEEFTAVIGDCTNLGVGEAIASSVYIVDTPAIDAFDDDINTDWMNGSGTIGQWVGWSFDPTLTSGSRINLKKATISVGSGIASPATNCYDRIDEVALETMDVTGIWTERGRLTTSAASLGGAGRVDPPDALTLVTPVQCVACRWRVTAISPASARGGTYSIGKVAEVEFIENIS